VRIGLVLSAGGLRGAAHLGVLRRLVELAIPIDAIAGASAGAIVAAYYAGVGLSVHDLIGDAPGFRGRHLALFGLALRLPPMARRLVEPACGVIPERLRQLESSRFDRLHHGVTDLGIVCHDVHANAPCYFSTRDDGGLPLAAAARASAAVPGVFRARTWHVRGRDRELADGGLSDPLPVEFSRTALGCTHVIVSDCRRGNGVPIADDRVIHVRPGLGGMHSFRSPTATLMAAVDAGDAAVSPSIADALRTWAHARASVPREASRCEAREPFTYASSSPHEPSVVPSV
jgi:NTE family protein